MLKRKLLITHIEECRQSCAATKSIVSYWSHKTGKSYNENKKLCVFTVPSFSDCVPVKVIVCHVSMILCLVSMIRYYASFWTTKLNLLTLCAKWRRTTFSFSSYTVPMSKLFKYFGKKITNFPFIFVSFVLFNRTIWFLHF